MINKGNSYIAISGMIGSGKSTLARELSAILGWKYVHESNVVKDYLSDLFQDTKRWALETQMSFLINKSIETANLIQLNQNFILDRTLAEDVYVFENYFFQNGFIDKRSHESYMRLAKHFISTIPKPDIVLNCKCPFQVSKDRMDSRSKTSDSLLPANFLTGIYDLYSKTDLYKTYNKIYEIDTDKTDFRVHKNVLELLSRLTL